MSELDKKELESMIDSDLIINKKDIIPGNIYQIKHGNDFYIGILSKDKILARVDCESPEGGYLVTANSDVLVKNIIPIEETDVVYELHHTPAKYARSLFNGFNIFWNKDEKCIKRIFFLEDLNILPLDKFLGIRITKLYNKTVIGYINFDILTDYKPTTQGNYIGLSGEKYRCVLPYSDTTYEIWKKYRRNTIKDLIEGMGISNYELNESFV